MMACALVCVCIYIFICMYITHTGMREILFIHVCWYLLFIPDLLCSVFFCSCFCFVSGVCNEPFYMPRLQSMRPLRHSINNNARRCCCCYCCSCCCSIFCCFNGMPLNNFIKCFVWTLKRHKKGLSLPLSLCSHCCVALSSVSSSLSLSFFVFLQIPTESSINSQATKKNKKQNKTTHSVKSWIKHKFTHCV